MIHIDLPTTFGRCPSLETSRRVAKIREKAEETLKTSTDEKEREEAEEILAQCYAM